MRSEQISTRLLILMTIIIFSVLLIAIPQIVRSYQQYQVMKQALVDIQALKVFAETSNKISRERAPANKAMSSSAEDISKNVAELKKYRKEVDQQINFTVSTLEQADFESLAIQVDTKLRNDLNLARKAVDVYVAIPFANRNAWDMDQAILGMFHAWDSGRESLQQLVIRSKQHNIEVTDYASTVLILADLRDQAGRVASNIMAPLSFSIPFSEDNKTRSLQTQEQVRYLWRLMDTIQPESLKTPKYLDLHQQVKDKFIDQGLPIVMHLIQESDQLEPYSIKANQLTDALVGKFTTVVDLQSYLLEMQSLDAQQQMQKARSEFVVILFISLVSLVVAMFTMLYTREKLFVPLMQAQQMIVKLSQMHKGEHYKENILQREALTLADAVQNLRGILEQRDAFEFKLKNMVNTDSLTGVSNRLALDNFLNQAALEPELFKQLNLMVVDIDNFKEVNDQYGHIFGDQVIVEIASCLKANIAETDLIVRFGGDEFLVILKKMHPDWVIQISESILSDILRLKIDLPSSKEKLKVSVSIGIASGEDSWEALFHKADESLFKAKAKGRNNEMV